MNNNLFQLYDDNENRFNDVFQTDNNQTTGWSRESLDITALAPKEMQIGTLLVVADDLKTAKEPSTTSELLEDGALIGIVSGRDNNMDFKENGFKSNIIRFTEGNLTKRGVVIWDARNGGAIGDAQIIFPSDVTPEDKKKVFTKLKVKQGFKVLRQQVRG